ncbi:MAG TPA: hypothetical protein VK503_09885 [Candidatus Bathyarchaeia archaeon]|nr:hypothetical protein [Candidatus Bathyarchaeia archaeon]
MISRLTTAYMIICGGVLGLFFGLISFLSTSPMATELGYGYVNVWQYASLLGKYGMIGYPGLGVALYQTMVFWSILSLAGAIVAMCGGISMARSLSRKAILFSVLGGILLLLTFLWVPAFIVIAGSLVSSFCNV